MSRFAFRAKEQDGRTVTGFREGRSAQAVAQDLSGHGLVPLTIDPAEAENERGKGAGLFRKRVRVDELILFSHQMHSLTRAGISVVRAVRGLAESSRNERMCAALDDVAADLESGTDLATSLRQHPDVFSELYASVVHVGENTGRLEEAFAQVARYLELERETVRRIKTAIRYPAFVIVAIGVGLLILNVFVIPAFAKVFEKFNAELPWQTNLLIGISDVFVSYWPLMLLGLGALAYGVRRWLATPEGRYRWDRLKLRLPIIGSIFVRINLARFCQTFAMVSRSGVPITRGLHIVSRAMGNEYLASRVDSMRAGIERGAGIAQTARESGMFTPVVLQMIAVGEETGAMDTLLEQAAGFYEEEVDYDLKGLTDVMEPVLIMAIGAMVLVLALGVFLPLWDLSGITR